MHPYPHLYTVHATAEPTGDVPLNSPGLPALPTAPPAEFDGPGDRWSLEKSEHVCLVSNSLVAQRRLEPTVIAA